jgi:hypothetical protein
MHSIVQIGISRAVEEISDQTLRIEGDAWRLDGTRLEYWTNAIGEVEAYDPKDRAATDAEREIIAKFLCEVFPLCMAAAIIPRVIAHKGSVLMEF